MRARLSAVTLLTCIVVSSFPSAAVDADPAARDVPLASFAGSTDSYALGFEFQLTSGLPLPFGVYATRTQGYVDSQPRAQGYAAVVSLPLVELLAATGGLPIPDFLPVPDDPPTYCYSNYPGTEDATCGPIPPGTPLAATPVSGGIGRTEAHGDPDKPELTRTTSRVTGLDLSASGVQIRTSTSESDVRVVDGAVVSTTKAALEDVSIADVLSIQKIEAFATTAARGTAGRSISTARLTIVGATVGGIPVRITSRGIEAADIAVPLPFDALSEAFGALADAGVSIVPLRAPVEEVAPDGTKAVASVAGPLVTFQDPNGNRAVVGLGFASASSTAIPGSLFPPGDDGLVPLSPPVLGGPSAPPNVLGPPLVAPPPPAPALRKSTRSGLPIGDRFRLLYLSGMAALVVLVAASVARRNRFATVLERRF